MTTVDTRKNYEAFLEKRNTLISLIDRQISLLSSLSIDTEVDSLQKLRERVSTDVFKILIVGEFKRGKSTFINAMLGQEILPAYATPCTAVINEVKWGESPRALVHYNLTENDVEKQVETIPVEAIEEYVVIPENPPEDYINPYEKVEIFYPLELCRSGVEVIDSPGLNEHSARTQVTESYLHIVDAIIFVFTCEALASQSEIQAVENIRSLGHEELFFVCNKFDQIRKDTEKERVKKFAFSKLTDLTKRGENGIFFISAANALDGRLDEDEEKVDKSGVSFFEKELGDFLIADRGRLKILEPAKDMQESIRKAQRSIPEREALLNVNQDELEKRYVEAQGKFDALEQRRKQIEIRINQFLQDVKIRIFDEGRIFFGELPPKVEGWVNKYEIKADLSFIDFLKANPFKLEKAVEAQITPIVKELSNHLAFCLETEFLNWKQSVLDEFLVSRMETLKQDIDARASEFIREADYLRAELSSGDSSHAQQAVDHFRLLGNAFSVSILKGSIAAGGVFSVIGFIFASPIALVVVPAIIAGALIAKDEIKEKIKKDLKTISINEFSSKLKSSVDKQADLVASEIINQLGTIKKTVDQGLTKEIQSIRDQVESVLKEKKKGEASVAQKVRELTEISQALTQLEGELDDLINQLALI